MSTRSNSGTSGDPEGVGPATNGGGPAGGVAAIEEPGPAGAPTGGEPHGLPVTAEEPVDVGAVTASGEAEARAAARNGHGQATVAADSGDHAGLADDPADGDMPRRVVAMLSVGLAAISVLALLAMAGVWPSAVDAQQAAGARAGGFVPSRVPLLDLKLTADVSEILLASLAGVLGGCLHAMTALPQRPGHRKRGYHYPHWYLLTPVSGGAVALLLYAAVRGGLLTGAGNGISLYGVVAIGGVAGLFSRKVLDRLASLLSELTPSANGQPAQAATDANQAKPNAARPSSHNPISPTTSHSS
jgi:hypothetical protein